MPERQPPIPKVVPAEDPPRDHEATEEHEAVLPVVPEISMEEVLENIGRQDDAPEAPKPSKPKLNKSRRERGGRGAKTGIGDADSFRETPREARAALADVVAQFEDVSAQSRVEAERTAVLEAETAYLTAYKQFEQKKTIWNRLAKGKDLKEESEKVEALKRVYDEKRVVYAEALTGSAKERLVDTKRADEKLERYNRLVRFREVVKPAAEKRLAARKEALDARGRNVFEKALGWSATHNQKLETKYGKTGARALRALTSAVLISGGAAVLGAAGIAAPMSLVALAGFGTYKFARCFGGAVLGAGGAEVCVYAYEKFFGRKHLESAKESLKTEGRASEISLESLQAIDAVREKLGVDSDEITLRKKKALVKAITAFGIGASSAAILAEFVAVQHAAEVTAASASDMKVSTHASVAGQKVMQSRPP